MKHTHRRVASASHEMLAREPGARLHRCWVVEPARAYSASPWLDQEKDQGEAHQLDRLRWRPVVIGSGAGARLPPRLFE